VPLFVLEVVAHSGQPPSVLVDWLEDWSYLEAAPGGEWDRTLLLVLARLLEGDPEPGLVPAMARIAELLLPLMAQETDPLARRRHELLSNNGRHFGRLSTPERINLSRNLPPPRPE
jgi:hypothetical protein